MALTEREARDLGSVKATAEANAGAIAEGREETREVRGMVEAALSILIGPPSGNPGGGSRQEELGLVQIVLSQGRRLWLLLAVGGAGTLGIIATVLLKG